MRSPAFVRTFVCLALLLAAACRGAPAPVAGADLAGVYALASIDGNPLPCDVSHGDTSVPVRRGAFTIRADGTCASSMTLAAPGGRDVVVDREATWTRQGAVLTMAWRGFGVTTGSVAGEVLDMENEGHVYSYRR